MNRYPTLMNRLLGRLCLSLFFCTGYLSAEELNLPYAQGHCEPSWKSLQKYQCPDWFKDAKFGIWAHWGPQCQPEDGDWYARKMYIEGSEQYDTHLKTYGHPSVFGFKDVCNLWKAENFDAQKLVDLYKKSGAKYFVAMAVHHDNFDLWNSKYQPWNSVNIGPKQDLIGKWAAATRAAGLHFGVTVHAVSAWSWYEVAQGADKNGPKAGVPYDGKLTKADGKGTWWEGYDPQDLYEQNHRPSSTPWDRKLQQTNPGELSNERYGKKFYNRIQDLVEQCHPDLLYFDDFKLPLWGRNQAYGLSLVASLYNSSIKWNGQNQAVVNTKSLSDTEKKCIIQDVEVGSERDIQPEPWQADACIGHWHYLKNLHYMSYGKVIHGLIDVVSKNGNLLLNVPIKGDGTIDNDEVKVLNGIGAWLSVNGEAIYGTRPWKVYGEGPTMADKLLPQREKGGIPLFRKDPYVSGDIRFTTKGDSLYAISMAWPDNGVLHITSLSGKDSKLKGEISKITMLGSSESLKFKATANGLDVFFPAKKPCDTAYVLKIEGGNSSSTAKL